MNAIGPWLFAGGKGNVISRHFSYKQTDIFVIGLQEMVDLTATTVVSESQSMKRSQTWIDAISSVLNESVRFPFLSFFLSQHSGKLVLLRGFQDFSGRFSLRFRPRVPQTLHFPRF